MSVAVAEDQIPSFVERAYGLRVRPPLVDLPQGVHSAAWLLHTDDGDWVIKISDPRSDPPESLIRQCELYGFLRRQGLHVPVVRAERSGRLVGSIDGYPVTVMRRHRLRRLAAESITAEELRRIGAEVGRLHTAMASCPQRSTIIDDHRKSRSEWGQQDVGCYAELINSPTTACFSTAERSWIESLDTSMINYLDRAYPDPATLSQTVLHGDLAFGQVQLLPDGAVYFFDFGDMSWGPVAHELAQFLRGLADAPISYARWLDLRRWLLEGYRSEHPLTAADADAIDVFLINRVVALARYVLEISGEVPSPTAAEIIKRSYGSPPTSFHCDRGRLMLSRPALGSTRNDARDRRRCTPSSRTTC